MKKFLFIIIVLSAMGLCPAVLFSGETGGIDGVLLAQAGSSVAEKIIGEWEMAPYNGVVSGKITFSKNGTYESSEKHTDGIGVGKKGQYKIDASVTPVRIDLCLDKCGAPGSEWTTLFSILRFHSNDELEIRMSPDSNHPKEFAKKGDDYTMMLKRLK
ncbi:MAG: hypothetical protein JXQ30_02665 [Spirochaetes bacterium]|nr:hypothetical protein [Spirochaetota bacterium]